jgi:creatinine amidohydrolase
MTRLADMTWKDVRSYLERRTSLIVPIGTCEQHGPHLPLSTDTRIAEAFAEAVANASGIVVAPTLPYGVNLPCDRFVPGTAGLSFDGLRECVRSLLRDWTRQGFSQVFMITAHGCATNGFGFAHHEAIKQGALPLLEAGVCEAFILFPYWNDVCDLLTRQSGVEHAGEVETSLALHLFPEEVRMDLVCDGEEEEPEERFLAFPEGVPSGPPPEGFCGAEGYPSSATAEKGRQVFERCLAPMVRFVTERAASGDS